MVSVLDLATCGDPGEGQNFCSSRTSRPSDSAAVSASAASLHLRRSLGVTAAAPHEGGMLLASHRLASEERAPLARTPLTRRTGTPRGSSALRARRLDVAHLRTPRTGAAEGAARGDAGAAAAATLEAPEDALDDDDDDSPQMLRIHDEVHEPRRTSPPAPARDPQDFSSTECVVNFGEPLRCRPVLFQELLQQPAFRRKGQGQGQGQEKGQGEKAPVQDLQQQQDAAAGRSVLNQEWLQRQRQQHPSSPLAAATWTPESQPQPFHLRAPLLQHRRRTSSEVSPLSSTAAVIDLIPPSMSSNEVHKTVAGLWHDSLEMPPHLGGAIVMDDEESDSDEEVNAKENAQERGRKEQESQGEATLRGDTLQEARRWDQDRHQAAERPAANETVREGSARAACAAAEKSSTSARASSSQRHHHHHHHHQGHHSESENAGSASPSTDQRRYVRRSRNSSITTVLNGSGSASISIGGGNSSSCSSSHCNSNSNNNNNNHSNSNSTSNNNSGGSSAAGSCSGGSSRCGTRRDQAWTQDTLVTMPGGESEEQEEHEEAELEAEAEAEEEEAEEEDHHDQDQEGGRQARRLEDDRMCRNQSNRSSSCSRGASSSMTWAATSLPSLPCLPLPNSETLKHGVEKEVEVVQHRSRAPHVEAIALFLPGVNGGVGPCRSTGNYSDETALFPTLAEELSRSHPVDCYRLSWSQRNPKMDEAVHAVTRTLLYALTVVKVSDSAQRPLKVFMIGHSLGSAVAMQTGLRLQSIVPSSKAELGGVALLAPQWVGCADAITKVEAPTLIVHGLDDEHLGYGVSLALHNKATAPATLKLVRRCDHNFTGHKTRLIKILMRWVLQVSKVDQ